MAPRMRIFPRYRRPSVRTVLGITRAKRRIKTASGFYAATRWTRAPYNAKRRLLRRAGYYTAPMRFLRFLTRKH